MIVELYQIDTGDISKNQVLKSYDGSLPLDSVLLTKRIKRYEDVTAPNFIKNLWKLFNEITIFDEGRLPLNVNYARIKIDNFSENIYFYVYDFEDLGRNQVKYHLKMDTVMTHVISNGQIPNFMMEAEKQLVLREHKDRFTSSGIPIYNETLEDVDVKPSIVETKYTATKISRKLVLKKIGGDAYENQVLSYPIYIYDVYGTGTGANLVDDMTLTLNYGWGIETIAASTSKVRFKWYANGNITIIEIQSALRVFRHVRDSNGVSYLNVVSGTSFNASNTTITGASASLSNGNIRLDGKGRLELDVIKSEIGGDLAFKVRYNYGINLGTPAPSSGLVGLIFAEYDSLQRIISSGDESEINYLESTNQRVIEIPLSFPFNKYSSKITGPGARIPVNTELGMVNYSVPLTTKDFDTNYSITANRYEYNDPKLFHSQFRPYYLSFKSESIPLRRESLHISLDVLEFQMKLNNSDYSKALLMSDASELVYKRKEMFELTKIIDLSNEISLIKDDFTQYLDTLYNNDRRLQELQIAKANRDLVSNSVNQVAGIGAGIVGGAIAGNIPGAVIGGVTGTIRAATNITVGIKNLNQMKEELKINYQNKIKELQYSLINIAGANPEFSALAETDVLKLFQFRPTNEELTYLDYYFHLYGYNTLEYKVPNIENRIHFNYLKAEIINYSITDYSKVTQEIIDDIIERYRIGVTILHINHHFGNYVDWKQTRENFERSLEQ